MSGTRKRSVHASERRREADYDDDASDDDEDTGNAPILINVTAKENIIKLRSFEAWKSFKRYWFFWLLGPLELLMINAYDICKFANPGVRLIFTCQRSSGWLTDYGAFNTTAKSACLMAEGLSALVLVVIWVAATIIPVIAAIIAFQFIYISNADIRSDRKEYLIKERKKQEAAEQLKALKKERKRRRRERELAKLEAELAEQEKEDEERIARSKLTKRKKPKREESPDARMVDTESEAPNVISASNNNTAGVMMR